jgi:hypothetical protein
LHGTTINWEDGSMSYRGSLVSLAALALLVTTASCGSDEGASGHGCGVSGAPASCGMSCLVDTDCGPGAYCKDDHTCTADCTFSGSECGDTAKCNSRGKCVDPASCTDLRCKVNLSCTGGAHTTLTGTVFAPNGTLPLYNAIVYVPNSAPTAFNHGVSCDRCNGTLSGDPVSSALTGPDGKFTLLDVPTGANIPLVIQLGRWRKQTVIVNVPDCATTAVDAGSSSLPKTAAEGDIPHMAIATGDADPLECLFIKLGISPTEITVPTAGGRIHFFRGSDKPGLNLTGGAPSATALYSSLDELLKYDVVLLPCEGNEFDKSKAGGMTLSPNPRDLLVQYLNMGGRLFTTHYSYDWLTYAMSPYNKVAKPLAMNGEWPVGQMDDYNNTIHSSLVTTFPKGMDFSKWLIAAGAKSAPGQLDINEGRSDLIGVDPTWAQAWATYDFTPIGGKQAVMHTTFNTPIDAEKDAMGVPQYCGRVVYSDFHATAGAITSKADPFPMACKSDPMTDQEKALAFMLFDLSSCVQQDSMVPVL